PKVPMTDGADTLANPWNSKCQFPSVHKTLNRTFFKRQGEIGIMSRYRFAPDSANGFSGQETWGPDGRFT
ncbi:MAG: hypothetical protein QOJ51_5697, partial [Acidobacteriaceae bacterium]|nr:hypothetical protein [Acidobacteriaceae bacterium]